MEARKEELEDQELWKTAQGTVVLEETDDPADGTDDPKKGPEGAKEDLVDVEEGVEGTKSIEAEPESIEGDLEGLKEGSENAKEGAEGDPEKAKGEPEETKERTEAGLEDSEEESEVSEGELGEAKEDSEGEPEENKKESDEKPEDTEKEQMAQKDNAKEALAEGTSKDTKKKKNRLYDIAIMVGILMVLGGGALVFLKYKGDKDAKDMYQNLEDAFISAGTESDTEVDWGIEWVSGDGSASSASTVWYHQISVNFDGLNDINEDVVGWIYQENGEISYPILYSGDNEKYLRTTLYGVAATCGSIFVEGMNDPYFQDKLTVVYGHNMKNRTMFGNLRDYKEEGYYKEHQYFQIYTEDGMAYRYQVFAYLDIDAYESAMVDSRFYDPDDPETAITTEIPVEPSTELEGTELLGTELLGTEDIEPEMQEIILNEDNTYDKYLETIRSRSLIEPEIEVTTEDKIVALFTCSTSTGNRFLVYGVQIADHNFNETADQNTDLESLDR